MPPTMGAAMRRITSEPVPLPHMIGSSPAMMAITVIIFGRTRFTTPCITAVYKSVNSTFLPSSAQRSRIAFQALSGYTSITTPVSAATPPSRLTYALLATGHGLYCKPRSTVPSADFNSPIPFAERMRGSFGHTGYKHLQTPLQLPAPPATPGAHTSTPAPGTSVVSGWSAIAAGNRT